MFVVIESNSWCIDDGAYLFDTFKEAFNYLSSRINPVFENWEEDKMKKCSNLKNSLTDEDRLSYEEHGSTDDLAFWCVDSDDVWNNGIHLSLYEIKNR